MAIRAAGDITVTSTETRIDVLAKRKIVLQAGASAITLDGQNLTIACPGKFDLKTGKHQFTGGDSQAAELPVLPSATVEGPPNWIAIQHRDADGQPFAGQNYKIFFAGGNVVSGQLDDQGKAHHDNVPQKADHVEYEPVKPKPDQPWEPLSHLMTAVNRKSN